MDFYSQSKAIAIIGITLIMIVILFLYYDKAQIKRDKLIYIYAISIGIFIGFSILATMLSEYREIALWGVHDRAEGMIITGCYALILLYVVYIFNDIVQYKYIANSLGFAVIIITIIGFTQYIGKDILLSDFAKNIIIPNEYAEARQTLIATFKRQQITGTLYNPNYVGSFCAMIMPIFIGITILEKHMKKKMAYAFLILCNLFLLIGSGSRAGLMGIGSSIFIAGIIFSKKLYIIKKLGKKKIISLMALIIVLMIIFQELWYVRVVRLAIDIKEMFISSQDEDDYRDEIDIREIVEKDGRVILVTQDNQIVIEVGEGYKNFKFYDSKRNQINYIVQGDRYITDDIRFENFHFDILYALGKEDLMGALMVFNSNDLKPKEDIIAPKLSFISKIISGLNHKDVAEEEAKLSPLFLLKASGDQSLYVVDPFTHERIVQETPESIGFKGKERLGSGRGYIWSRTIPMMKNTFFIGYGPDTYALEFPQNEFLAKYYALNNPQIIVDKPHNLYLQIGINNGVIALLGFIILISAYIGSSLKMYIFKLCYTNGEILGVVNMLAVAGYLAAGIFNDSNVSVSPIFWVLLGVGISINYLNKYPVKSN